MAQLLSNLPVGAKVKSPDAKYNGAPIIWLIGHKTANRVKLITEKIITLKCFDAMEASNPDSNRKQYGNNRYSVSNIDQWLNSAAGAGAWYSKRHDYDAPPTNANVWSNYNEYDAEAGFLSNFEESFRNAILDTTIRVVKSSVDGGGYEDITRKVYLLSATEVGLPDENGVAEGSKWDLFSDDNSRKAYPTTEAVSRSEFTSEINASSPWRWWIRTPFAGRSYDARPVNVNGTLDTAYAYNGTRGVRPALELDSGILVSDTADADGCYTIIWNTPPTPPTVLNVPYEIFGGKTAVISWNAGSDVDGNLAGYELERSINGEDYSQIYKGAALTYTDMITYGWNTVQYRVRSYDTSDAYSSYLTGALKTVINNRVPVISGSDSNLGVKTADFVQTYTVTDPDEGATVTVVEKIDGVVHRTYPVVLGATNTFDITGVTWLRLLNGSHTLTITATDDRGDTATRTYTFTKNVTSFTIQPTMPFEASSMPTRIALSVSRSIPAGSTFEVLVCNNANDASPTWEDATSAVVGNLVHVFTNTTKTAATWAVGIKVNVERGTGSGPCYVSRIGGNFE